MPAGRATSLRRWNIGVGLVHAVQAVAVLALATAFVLPVTATFIAGPARHPGRRPDDALRRLGRLGRRPLPLPLGRLPLAGLGAGRLRPLHRRPGGQPQLLPLGGVLALLVDHDRAHRDAHRHQRHRGPDRHLRRQRGDDLLRRGPGALREAGRLAVAVLDGLHRRHRAVARRRRLPLVAGQRRRAARLRLRDLRLALRLLQHLRPQHVAPVPTARPLALLHLRRGDLLHPQPGRQVRCSPGRSSRARWPADEGCAPWHDAPMVRS